MGSSRVLHELELLPLKSSSHSAPSLCTSRHSHLTSGSTQRYTVQSCVSHRTEGDPFAHTVRARISIDVNQPPPSIADSEDESAKEAPPFICRRSHTPHASGSGQNCASSHQSSGHQRPLDCLSPRAGQGEDGASIARKKLRLSKEKSAVLEERFKEHSTLNPKQKIALANQLNLRPRQVEVWFQNRRARLKLKQMEVDCDVLNRCCEVLSEENRQLQKEIAELRALTKGGQCVTCHGFQVPFPGTVFTMASSCKCHILQHVITPATSTTTSISSFDRLSDTS